MNHLPILQELFESDTLLFLIVGISIAVVMRIFLLNRKTVIYALAVSDCVCRLRIALQCTYQFPGRIDFAVRWNGCIG
jgi:hypothetical protein